MPNKKQSARPAESGWLLEVGVIGIDKTLKLIRLSKRPLLEIEYLFRPWSGDGLSFADKKSLPWRFIESSPFESDSEIEDEWESLGMDLEHDEELKSRKGGSRKALHKSEALTSRLMGNSPGVLRDNYEALVLRAPRLAPEWFKVKP